MEECGQVFIQMMDCLKDNGLEDAIHVLAKAIITGKNPLGIIIKFKIKSAVDVSIHLMYYYLGIYTIQMNLWKEVQGE